MKSNNTRVFFDIEIDNQDIGRIEFELFSKDLPLTTENFRALCTGEKGQCKSDQTKSLHYTGTEFHRIIPGFMLQGGDMTHGDGKGGESIYGKRFQDEGFTYKNKAYVLSMANCGKNTNGSQFFITTADCPHLDGKHVVFGKVLKGIDVVKKMEVKGSSTGRPSKSVFIVASGEFRD